MGGDSERHVTSGGDAASSARSRQRATMVRAVMVVGALIAASCSSGDSILNAGEDGPAAGSSEAPIDSAPTATAELDDAATLEASDAETRPSDVPGPTDAPVATEALAPTTTVSPLAELPPCPVEALDAADAPVEIDFWFGLPDELQGTLIELTDQYNASQNRVVVNAVNQQGYGSLINAYGISTQDSRPDLAMFPEYTLRDIASSDTVVPIGACFESSGYDSTDFLGRMLEAYAVGGVQWAMPFNVSVPVLYYNRSMFEAAGLDPDVPPVSLDELRAMSQQLVDSGVAAVGIAFDSAPDGGGGWFLEQWLGRAGAPFANFGNGRHAPATEVRFNGPEAVAAMTEAQALIDDGLAVNMGSESGTSATLFKMVDRTEPAAMAIATSASIAASIGQLDTGLLEGLTGDDLGIGAMPGPTSESGSQVGGASLWIMDKDDPAVAAAWDFVAFLSSPQSQSTWTAATGYVPIRERAVEIDPIASTFTEDPRYRVAYDELLVRADDVTANAPALGAHTQIRGVAADAVAAIFGGADVQDTLDAAVEEANALLAAWNRSN